MKATLHKVTSVPKNPLVMAIAGLVVGCLLMVAAQWLVDINGLLGLGGRVAFSDDELASARRATRNASLALDRFLGYDANARGWKQYLRFDELQRQLVDDLPHDQADVALLKEIVDQLSKDHRGLEMPQFVALRTSLSTYVKMLTASGSKGKASAGSSSSTRASLSVNKNRPAAIALAGRHVLALPIGVRRT